VEIEAVFGRLKQNWGFRRFMLRGLEKVSVEWGLLCMAHNMAKLAA
jgi:IS5 family transposase